MQAALSRKKCVRANAQASTVVQPNDRRKLRRVMGRVHPDKVQHACLSAAQINSSSLSSLNSYLQQLEQDRNSAARTFLRFFIPAEQASNALMCAELHFHLLAFHSIALSGYLLNSLENMNQICLVG